MQGKLDRIDATFQSGKHNQAIADVQTLIGDSQTDSLVYMVYDRLGEYLNYMGQHSAAIEAWEAGLKKLEHTAGGIDGLNAVKLGDWINILLVIAQTAHRQGKIK